MYATYDYYIDEYVDGGNVVIPQEEYNRYAKKADLELDAVTHNRIKTLLTLPDQVMDCACIVAELLYQSDLQTRQYLSEGLSGPVESWSNDGQSGKISLEQSVYTEAGRKKEILRLCRLYLGPLGLMYAGVVHYES